METALTVFALILLGWGIGFTALIILATAPEPRSAVAEWLDDYIESRDF